METSKRSTRRRFLLTAGSLAAAAALAGCASGTSRDAVRGREKDSTRDSIVKDLQATETWNVVHATPTPGTPPPEE
jgi:hypothetical protein